MDLDSTKSSLTGEKTLLAIMTEQETYMPVQGGLPTGQAQLQSANIWWDTGEGGGRGGGPCPADRGRSEEVKAMRCGPEVIKVGKLCLPINCQHCSTRENMPYTPAGQHMGACVEELAMWW